MTKEKLVLPETNTFIGLSKHYHNNLSKKNHRELTRYDWANIQDYIQQLETKLANRKKTGKFLLEE